MWFPASETLLGRGAAFPLPYLFVQSYTFFMQSPSFYQKLTKWAVALVPVAAVWWRAVAGLRLETACSAS